ncbi:hypothetical protein ACXOV9_09185, partial [Streptococcus thermophilus]
MNQDNSELNLEKPIFEALKKIVNRSNYLDIIVILDIIFEKNLIRFYDSSFSLLSLIDFSGLPDKIQEKVVDYFKNDDKE